MDYYQIFGISNTASQIEIKKAYRLLAKQYHPDKHLGNSQYEAKFKQINSIYEILSDPSKRTHYDQLLAIKNKPKEPKTYQTNFNKESSGKQTNTASNKSNKTKPVIHNPFVTSLLSLLKFLMKLVLSTYITRWLFSMFVFYLISLFFQFIYDFEVNRKQKRRDEYRQEYNIETGDIKFNNQDATGRVDSASSNDVLVDSAVTEPKTGDIKF
jgi:curved DNA-binding protein CbpA